MLHARLVLVSLCAVAVAGCEVPPPADAVWVTVPSGDSIAAVAESLAAYDIVESAEQFERFARMNRRHLGIEAGTYPLRPRRPMGEVLATLRRGTPPVTPVTIRERSTLAEVAGLLERSLGIEAERIEAAASDADLLERVGSRAETLEGYLYPTRYYFPTEAAAHELVRQMVDTFEARWLPHWTLRLDQLGMT
ncbi:MAG: endolytic transglycosylase MltG, partial [Gemmatimonadota bacterium]